jgi:hypothetical protein
VSCGRRFRRPVALEDGHDGAAVLLGASARVRFDVGVVKCSAWLAALRACARHTRQRHATARGRAGPRPVCGFAPERGAGDLGSGGALTEVQVHRGAPEGPYTGGGARSTWQRSLGGTALWSASARECRARRQFQFRVALFQIAKLQKVSTNFKISKDKSCRRAIDLQLSQRATYVLINRLPGNVGRSWQKSRPQVTVHSAFNSIFGQFALKIGMSANYEKCVHGNNEQLSYWQILNFYNEIWRTRKKTKSALKEI